MVTPNPPPRAPIPGHATHWLRADESDPDLGERPLAASRPLAFSFNSVESICELQNQSAHFFPRASFPATLLASGGDAASPARAAAAPPLGQTVVNPAHVAQRCKPGAGPVAEGVFSHTSDSVGSASLVPLTSGEVPLQVSKASRGRGCSADAQRTGDNIITQVRVSRLGWLRGGRMRAEREAERPARCLMTTSRVDTPRPPSLS